LYVNSFVARSCEETAPNHFLLLGAQSSDSIRRMLHNQEAHQFIYTAFLVVVSKIQ
jgi:hypothetical protein